VRVQYTGQVAVPNKNRKVAFTFTFTIDPEGMSLNITQISCLGVLKGVSPRYERYIFGVLLLKGHWKKLLQKLIVVQL
jgi:hypothetical protein